ncbi:amidase [Reyranella soli]|uniref:Indoleacetamide hydrolase n=1 Tax=Reyranella soli TaxID=1230389 RepID=A0A512NSI7_9HYPH|nr:amidase [Reyranella soli]GEP61904.1 putative amidase AmiD [Reyranella soli]
MPTDDLHYLSLDEVARRLKARKLSSVEATEAMLDRIGALDPKLKSYATVTPERALADARRLDAETAAGKSRGPLHGVPIAVKDLCNTEGVPTAAGMAIRRDHVPAKDATVVARLKQAGAVILGKLQMTEGAYGLHHPSVDLPVNPFNAAYWTGVSSSGSGVATAAGLCFASLGSDTGGSIRFPSTMNGLSGLKPTWGRVSRAGVFPLAESLDHVGPMCRSAQDAAIVLGVIAGADPDDPTASPHPVPDYAAATAAGVKGKRIGVPKNLIDADADCQRALDGALAALAQQGAQLVDVTLPELDEATMQWLALCGVEAAFAHEATFPSRRAEYGAEFAALLDLGRGLTGLQLTRIQLVRARVAGELEQLLASIDLLFLPVMGVAAPSLAAMKARTPQTIASRLRYTAPLDMSGHPTLTLPGGMTADGVPVGFQIVGRSFDEAGILTAGHAFQQVTDWHTRRPPV